MSGRAVVRWLAVVAWAGLIFFLSSQSQPHYPKGLSVQVLSTVGHLGAYFMLSGLFYTALRGSGVSAARALWAAVLLAVLYGISDEWHQSFVPGRDASPVDLAVDFVGASAAATLAHFGLYRLIPGARA